MKIVDILIFIAVLGIGMTCIYKSKTWATKLHAYYIRESKRHWYGRIFPWEAPWIFWLFRVMIIFFGAIFLLAAYPIAFGTVYL